MIQVEKSVMINKPVADVFEFVANSDNTTRWQGGVEGILPEGPPNVVGSRYTEVRKFMGQEMKSTMESQRSNRTPGGLQKSLQDRCLMRSPLLSSHPGLEQK